MVIDGYRDDGWQAWLPVGWSGEVNLPEVTAWRRTPPSFLPVVCHIVKRCWSGGGTCKYRCGKTATFIDE
jgi:hypothetical protein